MYRLTSGHHKSSVLLSAQDLIELSEIIQSNRAELHEMQLVGRGAKLVYESVFGEHGYAILSCELHCQGTVFLLNLKVQHHFYFYC